MPKVPESTPDKWKEKLQAARVSRLEQFKKTGVTLRLPPNPMPHITDRLVEIGLTEAAGMGAAPLSWQTIDAWQRLTMVRLAPWEARLMRSLSVEYLGEARRAEADDAKAPWHGEETAREAEYALLKEILG